MKIDIAIATVGLLVFVAHLFVVLFSRTRIPDILLLIFIGIAIGPIFKLVLPENFGMVGPVFTHIALAIILFEAGQETLLKVLQANWRAALGIALPAFFSTTLLSGYLIHYLIGLDLNASMVIGSILGSTSPSVIVPLLKHLRMASGPSLILTLESAVSDVLCIIFVLGFIEAHKAGGIKIHSMALNVSYSFGVAAFIGLATGFGWSLLLRRLRAVQNNIFLSLALVFILYGLTEIVHVSGAVAVLCFGAAVSNSGAVRIFWIPSRPNGVPQTFTGREKAFFSEIVFLLKTFFFVYLGLSLHLGDMKITVLAVGLTLLIFLLRIPIVRWTMPITTTKRDASLMSVMSPKGLAAAVLASVPLQQAVPGGLFIQEMTYSIILASIVLNSLMVFLMDKTAFGRWYGQLFPGFGERTEQVGD